MRDPAAGKRNASRRKRGGDRAQISARLVAQKIRRAYRVRVRLHCGGCHFRHRGGIAHRNGMGAYCRHVRADGAHRIGVDLFIYAGVASEYAFLPVKDGAWKSQLGAFIRRLLAGMSFVMLGVIGIVSCGLFEEGALLPSRAAFVGVILAGFACLAVGVFFFIYGGVVWDGYRKKVVSRSMKRADRFLTDEEKEDINAVLEERDALRAIAREDEQDNSLAGKLSSVIMLLATVAFLLLGFLGGLWHPGWVVFPVGGILCAVVGVIFKKDR